MKLPYWQKILYASGSLGVALSYQAFGTYIQFLYIDILGLKASLVGIRAMTSIIPILASAIVIWTLQRYPLHGERLKAMREKIAGMRSTQL